MIGDSGHGFVRVDPGNLRRSAAGRLRADGRGTPGSPVTREGEGVLEWLMVHIRIGSIETPLGASMVLHVPGCEGGHS